MRLKYYTNYPNEEREAKRTEKHLSHRSTAIQIRSDLNVPLVEPHFKDEEESLRETINIIILQKKSKHYIFLQKH